MAKKHQIKVSSKRGRRTANRKWRRQEQERSNTRYRGANTKGAKSG